MIPTLRRDRNPLKGLDCATHAWFLCNHRAGMAENALHFAGESENADVAMIARRDDIIRPPEQIKNTLASL
jgi:hypothetical protein